MKKRFSQEEVIYRFNELEPNYDFSKFVYKNSKTKSTIICDKGHEFLSNYELFYGRGYRCSYCAHNKKITPEEAMINLKNIHPTYDFSKFIYKNYSSKSTVICNKGHEYESSYHNLQSGYKCPRCSTNKKITPEEAIIKMKELEPNYDFSKFIYKNAKTKGIIICDKGHEYEVLYKNFVYLGYRCPHCKKLKSKPETEIIDFIKTFYNGTIEQSNRKLIKSKFSKNRFLELDIYLPEINLAIEYNGEYFHSDEFAIKQGWNSIKEKHDYKLNECNKLNIKLIYINEKDFKNNKFKILKKLKNEVNSYLGLPK